MSILKPYQRISDEISQLNKNVTLIVVTKTFSIDHISPLIKHGHLHFGENKVQEASIKWKQILLQNSNLSLHMIGNLQSNKVDEAVSIFSYIHSLDSEKLALKLHKAELKYKKNLKYFCLLRLFYQCCGSRCRWSRNYFAVTKEFVIQHCVFTLHPPVWRMPV